MSFKIYQRHKQGPRGSGDLTVDKGSVRACSFPPGNSCDVVVRSNTQVTAAVCSPSQNTPLGSDCDTDSDASGEYEPLRVPFTDPPSSCDDKIWKASPPSLAPPLPPPRPPLQVMRSMSPQPQCQPRPMRPRSGSLDIKCLRLLSWKRRSHHEAEDVPASVSPADKETGRESSYSTECPPRHRQLERLLQTTCQHQRAPRQRNSLLRRWTVRHRRPPSSTLNNSLPDLSTLAQPASSTGSSQPSSPAHLGASTSLAASPRREASPNRPRVSPQALRQALRRLEAHVLAKVTGSPHIPYTDSLMTTKDTGKTTENAEYEVGDNDAELVSQQAEEAQSGDLDPALSSNIYDAAVPRNIQDLPEITITDSTLDRGNFSTVTALDEDDSGYVKMETIQQILHSPLGSRPSSPCSTQSGSPDLKKSAMPENCSPTSLNNKINEEEGDYLDMEGIQQLRDAVLEPPQRVASSLVLHREVELDVEDQCIAFTEFHRTIKDLHLQPVIHEDT